MGKEEKIYDYILGKKISFSGVGWKHISEDAKDLCKRLLDRNFETRITMAEALEHKWFNVGIQKEIISNQVSLNISKLIENLKGYRTEKKFQKEVVKIMVMFLSDAEIKHIRELFRLIDFDHDGIISFDELKTFMVNNDAYEGDDEIRM